MKASHINELRAAIEDLDSGSISGDLNVESITVTDSDGIMWENGISRITHNDGGGNVQIRFGHDYTSSDERFTQAGGSAFYIGGALDGSKSDLEMKVGTNASPANNDPVTWGPTFSVTDVGISTGGTITAAGDVFANGTKFEGDGKEIIRFSDSWLRLNQASEFSSGTYTPGDFIAGGNVGIGTTTPSQKLHVTGNVRADGRHLYLGSAQDIYGDNGANIYMDSNHTSATGISLRDRDDTQYGRLYGSGNGANFGLLDGDSQWGLMMVKDNYTSFNINNTERMRILNSGNVGIGTAAPAAKLELRQNGEGLRIARSTTQYTQFVNNSGGATIQTISPTNNAKGLTINSTNPSNAAATSGSNYVRINVRGTEALRVADGGNVGIGRTAPTQKLDVNGHARFNSGTNYSYLNIGSQSYDQLYADNTSGGSYGGGLWFRIANSDNSSYTDSLRLAANGNVGIGVNPTVKLDVSGTVKATSFSGNGSGLTALNASNISSGTLNLARIANNTIAANKLAPSSVGASEVANGSLVATTELSATGTKNSTTFLRGDNTWATLTGDNLGNHTATTTVNANDQEIRSIRALQGKDWDDNTGGTDSKYRVLYRDGAHMFYDGGVAVGSYANGTWTDLASGDLVVQNQVGIGTTTTTGNLASGASLAIGDSDTGLKQMGDGQLAVFANNVERMRLAGGSVTIGVDNTGPANTMLTVNGGVNSNEGGEIRIGTAANYDSTYGYYYMDAYQDDFRIGRAGAGTDLVLRSNGNFGIGTLTPSQKVHTTGNIRADGRHIYLGASQDLYGDNGSALYYDSNNSTTTQMIFRDKENLVYGRIYGDGNGANFGLLDNDGHWGIKMATDSHTSFNINNSEKMRIQSNGNVGIGTTSASGAKLVVAGGAKILNGTGNELGIVEYDTNGVTGPSLQTDGANTLAIRPFGAGATTINGTGPGNVGIGLTNPVVKLDVGGNIQAGSGSGGVALTTNDGYGNANVTFNHLKGIPDATGNSGRIVVNTDSTSNAYFAFQLSSGVTAGAATPVVESLRIDEDGSVRAKQYCDETDSNCIDLNPAAGAPRVAMFDEITSGAVANLSTGRNAWNTLVNETEAAGSSNVAASNWKENCTWNSNEALPTSSATYAEGHETVRERMDWCGRIICRWHPDIEGGQGYLIETGANGSTSPNPGQFNVQCIVPS